MMTFVDDDDPEGVLREEPIESRVLARRKRLNGRHDDVRIARGVQLPLFDRDHRARQRRLQLLLRLPEEFLPMGNHQHVRAAPCAGRLERRKPLAEARPDWQSGEAHGFPGARTGLDQQPVLPVLEIGALDRVEHRHLIGPKLH